MLWPTENILACIYKGRQFRKLKKFNLSIIIYIELWFYKQFYCYLTIKPTYILYVYYSSIGVLYVCSHMLPLRYYMYNVKY